MTDQQPQFHCPKGHLLGWKQDGSARTPSPCWRCRDAELRRDAAKRRQLGHVVAGVDVRKAFALYRKLAPFAGNIGRHVTLTIGHKAEGSWSGHAVVYSRKRRAQRIRVAYGPAATSADVLEVLVHEMCHLACPSRTGHGEQFRLTLRRAARELWGIELPLLTGKERGAEHNAAYAMDRILIEVLNERLQRGELDLVPFAPDRQESVSPEVAAARRRAKLARVTQARAVHAGRMLARAESDRARAERREAHWRKKVAYYRKRGLGALSPALKKKDPP